MSIITFKPLYQERVWGGRDLENRLGRKLPEGIIGESWEIVDRPEAESVIQSGDWKGLTLQQALEHDSDAIMGPHWPKNKRFPLLIKWLDCKERLSLQVHPPASIASELGGEPKTEHWYIAAAQPTAGLIVGLKKGATKESFNNAIKNNTLEELVHRVPAKQGDSIFVPSGRIHAIDGGNLILEIQQNSDTTYRVYDWARVGLDGKPRTLHIKESLASIDFEDFEPPLTHPTPGEQLLTDCQDFRIRKLDLNAQSPSLLFSAQTGPHIISIIEGSLEEKSTNTLLEKGLNVLLPFQESFEYKTAEDTILLVTDQFTPKA